MNMKINQMLISFLKNIENFSRKLYSGCCFMRYYESITRLPLTSLVKLASLELFFSSLATVLATADEPREGRTSSYYYCYFE